LTLIELLVALVVVAFAMAAVSRTFQAGLSFEGRYGKALDERLSRSNLEDRLSRLFEGANLKSGFVFPAKSQGSGLTFCTWSAPTAFAYRTSQSQDFEALNSRFGPQGGAAEIGISTEPTGNSEMTEGLFVRIQRPPDNDPSQGGEETLADPTVREAHFEFFDGTNWVNDWDSREQDKDKMPRAVRMTLIRADSSQQDIVLRLGGGTGNGSTAGRSSS
jgi:type II secretory pathway pseudopilin PulG